MTHILFWDCETTGFPDWKSPSEAEHQPHLVQIAAHLADAKTRKISQSMDVIIKPEGWEIPQECVDVHGITTEYAIDVGVPEPIALQVFLELWRGRTRVAHNATFDNRIIRIATKRYCTEDVIDSWHSGHHECTMLQSKPICEIPPYGRYGWKSPKLSEAYKFFFGEEFEDAHTAIADVNACMRVYWAIQDHCNEKK